MGAGDAARASGAEERARLLNNLSLYHGALGRREAALASALEAVSLHRRLADVRPEVFLPDLAMSLNNLSIGQRALGQHEAALASTLEAVALYRRLAEGGRMRSCPISPPASTT